MNRQLDNVIAPGDDSPERQRVVEATRRLQEWAVDHPPINPGRVYSTCLCLAEPAPGLTTDDLVVGSKIILWIFAFDDLIDEGDLTHHEVQTVVDRYSLILEGAAPHTADPLALLLREVCDGLARYPMFDSVRHIWAPGLSETLHAMFQEHQWRQRYLDHGIQPTYSAYLENGIKSVAGGTYAWMALIMLGEASTARHADHLCRQIRPAAICVRLANDLRSYLKELAEGNVNSVSVHRATGVRSGRTPLDALEHARHQVERALKENLALCEQNARDVRTDTGVPERVIRDIAHWNYEFYSRHSYLDYRPGMEAENHGWTSSSS